MFRTAIVATTVIVLDVLRKGSQSNWPLLTVAAVCATLRTKFNMVTSANVSDDGGIRHDALPMHTAVYTCMLATSTGEMSQA